MRKVNKKCRCNRAPFVINLLLLMANVLQNSDHGVLWLYCSCKETCFILLVDILESRGHEYHASLVV